MTRQLMFFKLGIMAAALALALPLGSAVAAAVLLGAAIGFAANHRFAHRVLTLGPAQRGKSLLAGLYRAELAKLVVVGALFAAVFAVAGDVNVPALLAGFLVVHLGASVAALVLDPSTKG